MSSIQEVHKLEAFPEEVTAEGIRIYGETSFDIPEVVIDSDIETNHKIAV